MARKARLSSRRVWLRLRGCSDESESLAVLQCQSQLLAQLILGPKFAQQQMIEALQHDTRRHSEWRAMNRGVSQMWGAVRPSSLTLRSRACACNRPTDSVRRGQLFGVGSLSRDGELQRRQAADRHAVRARAKLEQLLLVRDAQLLVHQLPEKRGNSKSKRKQKRHRACQPLNQSPATAQQRAFVPAAAAAPSVCCSSDQNHLHTGESLV